jgi:WD40 repeat protein
MKNNPYVGPRPYQRRHSDHFYGRNREARDLLALMLAERVVLFYAQSGAGKTSLLNAKVIPDLEDEGFRILPVARVGNAPSPEISPDEIDNLFMFSLLLALSQGKVAPRKLRGATLSSFLLEFYPNYAAAPTAGLDGQSANVQFDLEPPLLILDQFEELFTTHRDRWREAEDFFRQLRDALDRMPPLGILFTMREDYVAEMEPYAHLMPGRLRARYRIEPLGAEGALAAITKPAESRGIRFDPGVEGDPAQPDVARWLRDELRKVKVQRRVDGRLETTSVWGPFVEPVQLQVVCHRMWEHLPEQEDRLIEMHELEQYGDIDRALIDFYAGAVQKAVATTEANERQIRRWFEQQLITPLGTRGLALRGEAATAGLPNAAVDALRAEHILGAEVRAGARWYELAHDRLVDPVLQSNAEWEAAQETPLRLAAEDERRRRRRWTLAGGVAAAFVILLVSYLAIRANRQRRIAEENERLARARQLAAQSLLLKESRLDLALLLSLEANQLSDLVEVRSSLPAVLATRPKLITFLHGHEKETGSVAISPDGRRIATADGAGAIRLWDATTRERLSVEPLRHPESAPVNELLFSPDGRQLASFGDDGAIYFWNVATQQPVGAPLTGHEGRVVAGAFYPDGSLLASAGTDKLIYLWDVAARRRLDPPLTGHTAQIADLAFSPDGQLLASASCGDLGANFACRAGEIRLWEVASRQTITAPLPAHENWVTSLDFSPDSQWLASAGWDQQIRLWYIPRRQPFGEPFVGHTGYVNDVRFSPDGRMLASASHDGTVRLWDVGGQRPLGAPLEGHQGVVRDLAFGPRGRLLASASADNTAILWDTAARQVLGTTLAGHSDEVLDVAYGPQGLWIASASADGTIILWDARTGAPVGAPLTGHVAGVNSIAFRPTGQRALASLGADGALLLWDPIAQRALVEPRMAHPAGGNCLAFSSNGQWIATGGAEGRVIVWDAATLQPSRVLTTEHGAAIYSLAFAPGSQILAAGGCAQVRDQYFCERGEVRLWHAGTGQPLGDPLVGHQDWVLSLAFSPDGETLISGGADDAMLRWNVAARPPISTTFGRHSDWVLSLDFSPDGARLASASKDQTVALWDVATQQQIGAPLTGHTGWVYGAAFSPDGRRLVSASGDHTLVLWDVDFASWQARACQRANRNLTVDEWTQYVDAAPASYRPVCSSMSTRGE